MDNNLALKRFFSKSTLESLISGSPTEFINYVIKRYISEPELKNYKEIIEEMYRILDKEYRTEYYYKNTMLNKLLFKQHNIKTTSVLTELPIGKAKADFVMINGKGVVYEIKTELDNLDRLADQVQEYYKAFDQVMVVTYQENVDRVKTSVPDTVGIMVLTKRNALNTVRPSKKATGYLDKNTIFKVLRKPEFEDIILSEGYDLPDVSQFDYYKACYGIFEEIDTDILQSLMLKQLKARTKVAVAQNSYDCPAAIRLLTYSYDKVYIDSDKLNELLKERFGGAECISHI